MVLGSFKTAGRVPPVAADAGCPSTPTLDNYQRLFDQLDFPRYFLNSIVVAVVGHGRRTWCSARCSATRSPSCDFARQAASLMRLVLATLMVPGGVTLVPLFVLMSKLGLVNTYPGLILPFLAGPFGVFLMRQFILGHPGRAARGGPDRRRRRVPDLLRGSSMPLATPVLATLGILTFLGSWNSFLYRS